MKPAIHEAEWPCGDVSVKSMSTRTDHTEGGGPARPALSDTPPGGSLDMAEPPACPDAGVCAQSRLTPDGARRRGTLTDPETTQRP